MVSMLSSDVNNKIFNIESSAILASTHPGNNKIIENSSTWNNRLIKNLDSLEHSLDNIIPQFFFQKKICSFK